MVIRIEGRNMDEDMKKLRQFMKDNNIYYDEFTSAYEAVAREEIEATLPSYQERYKLTDDEACSLIPDIAKNFHDSKPWNNVFGDLAAEADYYTSEEIDEYLNNREEI